MRTFTTFREYLPAYKGNVLRCCLLGIVTTLMAITSGVHAAEITGTFGSSAGNINLTAEGPNDWIHWGLGGDTAVDRKLGVAAQISDFTPIGSAKTGSSKITFSWTDGNPTPSATTKTGIRVTQPGNGFQFSADADTTQRILKIYLSARAAAGTVTATLSDGSTAQYTANIDTNGTGSQRRLVTLTYAAASAGQTLNVTITLDSEYNASSGRISLDAAALIGE